MSDPTAFFLDDAPRYILRYKRASAPPVPLGIIEGTNEVNLMALTFGRGGGELFCTIELAGRCEEDVVAARRRLDALSGAPYGVVTGGLVITSAAGGTSPTDIVPLAPRSTRLLGTADPFRRRTRPEKRRGLVRRLLEWAGYRGAVEEEP